MDNLDWKSIRSLNGSKFEGFEELCAQLARAECPEDAKFERKGAPDAGVECYCVLPDGTEWGWQAKYFDSLQSSQWRQLDDSVKTALDKHPTLVRYFICVPMDRPDARIQRRKSALQRWNEHVQKWEEWAKDRGMSVEFVWWGSSELLDKLANPQHIGRVHFWFDKRGFDQDWFKGHLDESVLAAGPRYTPQIHVDLPIARNLELFGHSENESGRLKSLARDVRRDFQYASMSSGDNEVPGLRRSIDELIELRTTVLSGFADLGLTPGGVRQLEGLSESLASAVCKVGEVLALLRRSESDSPTSEGETESAQSQRSLRDLSRSIFQLRFTLLRVQSEIDEAHRIASSSLMILKGDAGTGKTHLLCDFASGRIMSGAPTVLLMGQRFREKSEPWTQVLQQLGMQDSNTEKFVGALEAAAQAANRRALVIIDALNEGEGRSFWPVHLSAFLARLEQSPWIATLLSVRSTYEEAVIPEDVWCRAEPIIHRGFGDKEYDAVQTFFSYYGIELPSAPILRPEFSNPLFLKMICSGLQKKGERRIPRGFHGITMVFDLYLDAVNKRLSDMLDYNPNDRLVYRALDRLAEFQVDTNDRWPLREKAEAIVNSLLPREGFSNSLYRALMDEGVLMADMRWSVTKDSEEIVSISYDRFADHLIAKRLLSSHLDERDPSKAFGKGGELSFLWQKQSYNHVGIIEAMCVQVPEVTGVELVTLAPEIRNAPRFTEAFMQSIVWRKLDALSEDTANVFNDVVLDHVSFDYVLDSLLTVSTIPGHRFNMESLDRTLRLCSMPDRDAWWSTYLHHAYGGGGAVDRLLDWTLGQPGSGSDSLEDQVIDLSAVTLAWMLTTSNRFLRDRATKALVHLLTNRFQSATALVARFADVDDPYVTERIYAVAYGVAMRSHDPVEVGRLATIVYKNVFASGIPPAHILLRDYARGVVERAVHLGANIDVNVNAVRPPYNSEWPSIPNENTIQMLESKDHQIFHSVMYGDFGIYIIGTNISWLSLRLDEDIWLSPEERLQAWLPQLNVCENLAWEEFRKTEETVKHLEAMQVTFYISISDQCDEDLAAAIEECDHKLERARQELESRESILLSTLTTDHRAELETITKARNDNRQRLVPSFDSRLIKRYVVWRVFDLGWTVDRFGHFDRFSIGYSGREPRKPERIGKKYQWIAYHEILAYISDHYQYRDRYGEVGGSRVFEGPWQEHPRDIDPSCTLSSTPGGTSWRGHTCAWWGNSSYTDWKDELSHQDWIVRKDDIPDIADELIVTSCDGTRWVNIIGDMSWQQPHSPNIEPSEIDKRDIWLGFTAYFVRAEDVDVLMGWANKVDFWNRWMPDPPNAYLYYMFLGEYGWAPAFRYSDRQFYSDHGSEDGVWIRPKKGAPACVQPASFEYRVESGVYDCSVTDDYALRLPHHRFLSSLELRWSGHAADYLDREGNLAAFDPTAHEDGPSALLVREDLLLKYLRKEGLALWWTILGEKWVVGSMADHKYHGSLKLSGAYRYTDQGPEGSINFNLDIPSDETET